MKISIFSNNNDLTVLYLSFGGKKEREKLVYFVHNVELSVRGTIYWKIRV